MLGQQYVYTDQAEIWYGRAHIAGSLSHAKFGFDQIIWVGEPHKIQNLINMQCFGPARETDTQIGRLKMWECRDARVKMQEWTTVNG